MNIVIGAALQASFFAVILQGMQLARFSSEETATIARRSATLSSALLIGAWMIWKVIS